MHEAEALRFWDGHGAVRLLAHDPGRACAADRALRPGTPLGTRLRRARRSRSRLPLMQRLWRPPSDDVPWRRIDEVAALAGRAAASAASATAPVRAAATRRGARRDADARADAGGCTSSATRTCTAATSCRAEREPWLAIDSKPIVAERAYDTVALVSRRAADAARSCGDGSTFSPSCSASTGSGCASGGSSKRLAWDTPGTRRGSSPQVGSASMTAIRRRRSPLAARRAVRRSSSAKVSRPAERPDAPVRRAARRSSASPPRRPTGRATSARAATRPDSSGSSTSERCSCPTGPATGSPTRCGTCLENPHVGAALRRPGRQRHVPRQRPRRSIVDRPGAARAVRRRGEGAEACAARSRSTQAFTHCSKAFLRSQLWDPERYVDRDELPSPGRAHARRSARTSRPETYDAERAERVRAPRRLLLIRTGSSTAPIDLDRAWRRGASCISRRMFLAPSFLGIDELSDLSVEGQGRHSAAARARRSRPRPGAPGSARAIFVVAYDHGGAGGAARLWWLLRHFGHDDVAVLRGGFDVVARPGARRRGGDRAGGVRPAAARRATRSTPRSSRRGSASPAWSSSTRAMPERYRGEVEPIDPVAGRIPGAVNWPYPEARELPAELADADEIVVYCGSGDHRVRRPARARGGGSARREALPRLVERLARPRSPGRKRPGGARGATRSRDRVETFV